MVTSVFHKHCYWYKPGEQGWSDSSPNSTQAIQRSSDAGKLREENVSEIFPVDQILQHFRPNANYSSHPYTPVNCWGQVHVIWRMYDPYVSILNFLKPPESIWNWKMPVEYNQNQSIDATVSLIEYEEERHTPPQELQWRRTVKESLGGGMGSPWVLQPSPSLTIGLRRMERIFFTVRGRL